MPVVLVGRNGVPKWLPEAPCWRKKNCLHAIRIPFCRLRGQDPVLTVNLVHGLHVCLPSTCSVKVLKLMNSCLSLLESQTLGPAFMVPVRMMGHLTVKLLRVSIPQNSPKLATSHFSWELQGPGFGDSAVWVAESSLTAELTPFPCWVLQPLLSSVLLWSLNISWVSGCLHTCQGPRDWSFCSITWHRAVSHSAGKHCTVSVSVILMIMHSSSAVVLPHF